MKTLLCLISAWSLAPIAAAGPLSLTWGAQGPGAALASAAGKELPPGCLVRLGFFDQPLHLVQEKAWDPAALEPHFTELARAHTGQFDGRQFTITGSFAQTMALNSSQLPPSLAQRTFCVWAGNSSSLTTATEIGIFSSSKWKLSSNQVGGLVWDLGQVEEDGIIVGLSSPTQSPTLGGQMNQLISVQTLLDTSDADGDGVERLLEEALGMNPALADADWMPAAVELELSGQVQPGYRYRRPTAGTPVNGATYAAAGFLYTVEVSDDLKTWRTDPSACMVFETEPAGEGFEIATLGAAPGAASIPEFYRLKVERNR